MFGTIVYKQYNGETVVSSANSVGLKSIAEKTGGEFFRISDAGDIDKMIRTLSSLPTKARSKTIDQRQ